MRTCKNSAVTKLENYLYISWKSRYLWLVEWITDGLSSEQLTAIPSGQLTAWEVNN